jgi:hypothetical protein
MPQGICSQCNALYNSERELQDHMGRAHRKFSLEPTRAGSGDAPANIGVMKNLQENTLRDNDSGQGVGVGGKKTAEGVAKAVTP